MHYRIEEEIETNRFSAMFFVSPIGLTHLREMKTSEEHGNLQFSEIFQ